MFMPESKKEKSSLLSEVCVKKNRKRLPKSIKTIPKIVNTTQKETERYFLKNKLCSSIVAAESEKYRISGKI